MIIDLAKDQSASAIDADICVIGAGAAGITIARSFAAASVDVCVLESGDRELNDATQSLYVAENVGLARLPHDATRLRYFGGTTNHWTGQCAPFAVEDFEVRDWVRDSGWPISKADLEPYYDQAYRLCDLDGAPFDSGMSAFGKRAWPMLDQKKLGPYFLQYSKPTRFGPAYGPELERAPNIRVLLNANVTEIAANSDVRAVDHVAFRTLDGRTGRVRARQVVLCCGGIENARLLLLSNGRMKAGLGNQNDVVGRYFMDHPFGRVGMLQRTGNMAIGDRLGEHRVGGRQYRFGLALGQGLQESEGVLGCGIQFWARKPDAAGSTTDVHAAPASYADKIMAEFNRHWHRVKKRFGGRDGSRDAEFFDLMAVTEQAPNPASRISLARDRDSLGLHRARVDWRLTALDRRTRDVAVRAVAAEFGRLDSGCVRVASWLRDNQDWNGNIEDYKHHMGTTRMAANPRKGVVDQNCRVHGLANLFIAGSSVFPTSSHLNPTLTIVALALRLSDHLRKLQI